METPPWPVLSQEAVSKLASGVHSTFVRWTALQLAVENEWGGRSSSQKAAQLENDVLGWFVHSKGAISVLCSFGFVECFDRVDGLVF